ncbi:MAG: ABC transporter family substrate-binding protein, partial [Gemmatimonadetes bacterium]|nr:ABC transporter family substrate-binding protein [Gemmatimonadota bacterium]
MYACRPTKTHHWRAKMGRRLWRGGLLPFALVAIVSACGGGDAGSGVRTDPAALSTTDNQINRMSRDGLQNGGTLTWALSEMPPTFNRHHLDGSLRDNADVMSALVLAAYTTDASGTPIWNPDLLASEPVLVTEPRQVVTYEINPRAAWYDGTPITWEDFHWQWRALNGTDGSYLVASSTGYEDIESVAMGSHEREVAVTYRTPFADWQALFSDLFPASTMRGPELFNTGWLEPITSAGPFKLESIDRTAQTITLVRNERWWGEPAKLERIVYRVIEPVAVIDALANGEVDFMDIGPDASAYRRATSIAGVDIRVAGGPNFRHITMNGTSPNLQDLRVRQALAMGIDRTAIARALLQPL